MTKREAPRFTGVGTYQDRVGRFSVRYPTDWLRQDHKEQDGATFLPNPVDPHTSFSVRVADVGERVVAEDLEDLKAGVSEGLAKLADCRVEAAAKVVLGNVIRLERTFTFCEDGATRKRKVWLVYVDKWLIVLTWQGSCEDEYEYWLAMVNYCLATFTLPEALWFATDRDVSGTPPGQPS